MSGLARRKHKQHKILRQQF